MELSEIMKAVEDIAAKKDATAEEVSVIKSQLEALNTATEEVNLIKSQLETLSDEIAKGKNTMTTQAPAQATDLNKSFREAARAAQGGNVLEKGLTTEADNGEATIHDQYSAEIIKELRNEHPFLSVVDFKVHAQAGFKNTVNVGGVTASWAGENVGNSEVGNTDGSAYRQISAVYGKLEAYPFITNELVRDSAYDVVADLKDDVSAKYGEDVVAAAISGNGTDKPLGLFSQTSAAGAYNKFKKLTIAAADHADAVTAKKAIRKIVRAVKAADRNNAVFLMNSELRDYLAGLVDPQGRSLIDDNIADAPEGRLQGKDIVIDESCPAMELSFGNHKRAFMVIAVQGLEVIEDKITVKGNTQYYHAATFGSVMADSKAIVVAKFAA